MSFRELRSVRSSSLSTVSGFSEEQALKSFKLVTLLSYDFQIVVFDGFFLTSILLKKTLLFILDLSHCTSSTLEES